MSDIYSFHEKPRASSPQRKRRPSSRNVLDSSPRDKRYSFWQAVGWMLVGAAMVVGLAVALNHLWCNHEKDGTSTQVDLKPSLESQK